MTDPDFLADAAGLTRALAHLLDPPDGATPLPDSLQETGLGADPALDLLAPHAIGKAARLGHDTALAHMDPPTPWVAWAATQWNAALNQNLLHPQVSPFATEAEARVIDWLAPPFGMDGGHMCPGSTIANLTAIWAAREVHGLRRVVTSAAAHNSVAKAAHLLGMTLEAVPVDDAGRMRRDALPTLRDACLVLTAGTTSAGAVDPLDLRGAWTHVDAAWAGPLRLTRHADRLEGIDDADSVAISAHKWLFQPKESALILFRDTATAHGRISFGGGYLAKPNIGVLGSHGAVAIPLLATLMAWGREGLAARLERCIEMADRLADWVASDPRLALYAPNNTGVVLWRATHRPTAEILAALPPGTASQTHLDGTDWIRNVAANPNADMSKVLDTMSLALS
ncbi:MAG: pyridoxal-dependent decarboxylase [Pseudomonadota bacterium]